MPANLARNFLLLVDADSYMLRHAGDLEYRTTDAPDNRENLDELVIEHQADGGSRADKFIRDERLLREDLRRNPANTRSVFYLAQTLRDLALRSTLDHGRLAGGGLLLPAPGRSPHSGNR